MKSVIACFLSLGLAGCATDPFYELMPFHYRPIELVVEVRNAKAEFDSAPNRYFVTFQVLEPLGKQGAVIHFVLDDVSESWRELTKKGTCWKISCDEALFDSEHSFGFSFWSVTNLNPQRLEKPNHTAEPASPSRGGSP